MRALRYLPEVADHGTGGVLGTLVARAQVRMATALIVSEEILPGAHLLSPFCHSPPNTVGDPVPNLMKKLTELVRSPQAGNAIAKAKDQAAKPENRRRLEQLKARVTKKP